MDILSKIKIIYAIGHLILSQPPAEPYLLDTDNPTCYEVLVRQNRLQDLEDYYTSVDVESSQDDLKKVMMNPGQALAHAVNTQDRSLLRKLAFSKGLSQISSLGIKRALRDIEDRLEPQMMGVSVRPLKLAGLGIVAPLAIAKLVEKPKTYASLLTRLTGAAGGCYLASAIRKKRQDYQYMMALLLQHARERGMSQELDKLRTIAHAEVELRARM